MHPEERDISYLWDMHRAAQEISEFILDIPYAVFEKDKKLRYTVEHQLMVISEAAAHVSKEFQNLHTNIPWAQIIGQRNVLAHEYGEILVERIWLTATKNLPELLDQLEKLIPEDKI